MVGAMSENANETSTFEPDPEPGTSWRQRLRGLRGRDKAVGLRGAAAVGLAGLVIGGAGGFGLAAATRHDDGPNRPGQLGGPWGGQVPSGHGFPGDPEGQPVPPMGGMPGGLPPGTNQEQETYPGGSNS